MTNYRFNRTIKTLDDVIAHMNRLKERECQLNAIGGRESREMVSELEDEMVLITDILNLMGKGVQFFPDEAGNFKARLVEITA